MAKIIYADGREADLSPENGKVFGLKELQNIVEGLIEITAIPHMGVNMVMVSNEEGLFQEGLKTNPKASKICPNQGLGIKGNVILAKAWEID